MKEKEVKNKENKDKKNYWKCPRCNTLNLKEVWFCTLCKREQPY